MTLKELLKIIVGKSLREYVEEGDFKTIRNTYIMSWFCWFAIGSVVGIELVRRGLVPL